MYDIGHLKWGLCPCAYGLEQYGCSSSWLYYYVICNKKCVKIDVATVLFMVAESPPVWESAVLSVYHAYLSGTCSNLCVCASSPFLFSRAGCGI